MNENSNAKSDPKIESVQRLYDAVARNDVDGILAELSEDVDWAPEGGPASVRPWNGSYRGRSEVPRFFQALASAIDIEDFTPLTYTSNDTDVMVPVRFVFTGRSTGKRAEMTMQHWWRFADGKIVFFRGAEDTEQSASVLR